MPLAYKPDWEETTERYRAWWAHEYFGRCALAVTGVREGAPELPWPPRPATPLERWSDLDYVAACNDYNMRRTFYGGEAFPTWNGGYPGHTSIPTFLGCPLDLDFDTGWWHPIITGESLEEVLELRIDRDSEWWKFTLKSFERAARLHANHCRPRTHERI